jgi:CNT family concentrative nucleoside transporter
VLCALICRVFSHALSQDTTYVDRTISVIGLLLAQTGFYLTSKNRSAIAWPTIIVGLFIQQAIAMFVLKTGAGFSIFTWIATLVADFLNEAQTGVAFVFTAGIASEHWMFASTVSGTDHIHSATALTLVYSSARSCSSSLSWK